MKELYFPLFSCGFSHRSTGFISSFGATTAARLNRCGVVWHRAVGPATALVTRCLGQPMLPAGSFGGNTWLNSAKPLSSLASSMLKQNMHVMPTIKKMVRCYTNCYTAWFTNDIDDYIINYTDQNISNASFVNGKIICTWCQVCLRGTGRSSHVGSSKIWNWTRIHDVKYDARFPSKRWSDPPMQHQLQLSNIINTPIFLGKGTGEKKLTLASPLPRCSEFSFNPLISSSLCAFLSS